MKHIAETHKNCPVVGCPVCDGGLFICTKCGLAEGSLTTDCPGEESWVKYGDKVYRGQMDFINGKWVEKTSPHSPAFYSKDKI